MPGLDSWDPLRPHHGVRLADRLSTKDGMRARTYHDFSARQLDHAPTTTAPTTR